MIRWEMNQKKHRWVSVPPHLRPSPYVREVGGFTVTVMTRVTAQGPVLTLDKRTAVWQVSVQEEIRKPRDAEGGVQTTGQRGQGRDATAWSPC